MQAARLHLLYSYIFFTAGNVAEYLYTCGYSLESKTWRRKERRLVPVYKDAADNALG